MKITMSIISCVLALLALFAVIWPVLNHVHEDGVTCVCDPIIFKMGGNYIVCFSGCPIKPVNSRLYNVTCSHMEDVTVTICEGEKYVTTKPLHEAVNEYTMNASIYKVWKVIASIMVWLCLIIVKVPSLCTISILNKLVNWIFKNKLKACNKCGSTYLITHEECPTPSFKHRTDYNLAFYILLVLTVLTTFVKADDNVYNYYRHGNTTEVQVLDKEHYHQDVDVNGYLYTISIVNSHLEVATVISSEVQVPIRHRFVAEHFSCDGNDGCKKECFDRTGKQPMYIIRKAHDGFSCVFTNAVLCGLCESDMKSIGFKVLTVSVNPYIDIEVKHGNKTDIIKIREFSKYTHTPYYVKPLEPILIESNEYFVTGSTVYKGQLCNMPSYGCFGPNYIKDNQTYMIVSPLVVDPMTHDRDLILEHCIDPGNSDINSLEKTKFIYDNGTLIQPFDFGMLSIGIPFSGKLVGDFCEKPVLVEDINVQGCYDCQSGIEITVKYHIPERCGQLKCLVGKVSYEYFVDTESNSMAIHSFFDKENLLVECNKYKKDVKLEHNQDTNYYKLSSDVHGSAAFDFNFMKHLPNLFYNFKFMSGMIALLLATLYMTYNICKQVAKHYFGFITGRAVRYRKKTDIPNNTLEESIFIGEAQ